MNNYGINLKDKTMIPFSSLSIFISMVDFIESIIASVTTKGYKALISTLDINRFRKALIMFFVTYNIAFHVVESSYYKELLLTYSAETLKPFLILAR
jgi:hypothetical protein